VLKVGAIEDETGGSSLINNFSKTKR